MIKDSINIIEVLGSHFNEAVCEPSETLAGLHESFRGADLSKRYEYIKDIAEGGLKRVTLEKDTITNRPVAVSFLKSFEETEEVLRFVNEAYLTAKLEHNNIIP
ncbi:MAG: hypothetical protein NE330_13965, partial [Lentisphaeraceae bacterium]|nr:hypothetical protein [Lentisphaeraceae bacterium]